MYVESCKGFQKCVQVFKTIAKASRDFQSLVESCTDFQRVYEKCLKNCTKIIWKKVIGRKCCDHLSSCFCVNNNKNISLIETRLSSLYLENKVDQTSGGSLAQHRHPLCWRRAEVNSWFFFDYLPFSSTILLPPSLLMQSWRKLGGFHRLPSIFA